MAQVPEAELNAHLQQLQKLRAFLRSFAENPMGFVVRDQRVSEDESLYVARIRRAVEKDIGVGLEGAQVQYSFYTMLRPWPESRDERIRYSSLGSIRGVDPAKASEIARSQVDRGSVTINGVGLLRAVPNGRILVVPYAGLRITKTDDYINPYKYLYLGCDK